jgi:hypothetical protein
MGGFEGFAAMSPAVILGAALQQQQQGEASLLQQQQQEGEVSLLKQQQQQQQQEPPPCGFYSSFHLAGESIAHRIGTTLLLLLLLLVLVLLRACPIFQLQLSTHLSAAAVLSPLLPCAMTWQHTWVGCCFLSLLIGRGLGVAYPHAASDTVDVGVAAVCLDSNITVSRNISSLPTFTSCR